MWAQPETDPASAARQWRRKVVVIMGPTGCGKSRLSIDLATRFFPSEIINSDKMQVYSGLDITTNKIPMRDRLGIPHHLLGQIDPSCTRELSPSEFRSAADSKISDIVSRRKIPLVVGGSNSFIYAFAANRFDPESDVFRESKPDLICPELRYDCCFLWVDVSMPVLNQYLDKRVDDMLDSGMFNELEDYFANSDSLRESDSVTRTGLRKAIGVPEFEPYFRTFGRRTTDASPEEDPVRRGLYDEAVRAIKDNTCQLAERQVGKILRLRNSGWDLRRLDATEAFTATMVVRGSDSAGGAPSDAWERQVVEPSVKIVKRFLEE
ncbi:isopentenyltransferase 1 [Actinidia rufa]|uniref:Isopentenyltransferase 1 n=1 Tax=Actinidia rufa TaxID=165716 RepID=A0A7J0DXG7_9ERIC|nr:isopentenyltransferase 1 [Actinidia rufa]